MEIKIRPLSSTEENETYDEVAFLFSEMYQYMNKVGLNQKLISNGEFLWINTIKKFIGKLNMVITATHEDKMVGFAAGNIRLSPNYLGNEKIGYISHVFVNDNYKRQSIGNKLLAELEICFIDRSVNRIELEVLTENKSAYKFWEKMGYKLDNLRMIKENEKV